jgi:periplasmic divalent cation tolerance protein
LFKTQASQADALIAAIAAAHSYAVPAIVAWDVAAAQDDYARWVTRETRQP